MFLPYKIGMSCAEFIKLDNFFTMILLEQCNKFVIRVISKPNPRSRYVGIE
jgi:hypothetical protein